jgi:D-threonate/D-erythronate kinase
MKDRCLIIADDLTGGADAGAQFAKRGLRTLLVSLEEWKRRGFARYCDQDVVVVNTDSRRLAPQEAFDAVSRALESYNKEDFPVLYKKIDSTLRGNIGQEIDAVLGITGICSGFFAPSFPEQERTVAGGILMVNGNPLSVQDTSPGAPPPRESNICKLLSQQSEYNIEHIDLTHVASGTDYLLKELTGKLRNGPRIIVFDAVLRRDLAHIADAGFTTDTPTFFVGSAGLAQEVAKKIPCRRERIDPRPIHGGKQSKHIFIIAGSRSSVTLRQMEVAKKRRNLQAFELSADLVSTANLLIGYKESDRLAARIDEALADGHALLKTCPETLGGLHAGQAIVTEIARICRRVLEKQADKGQEIVLVVTGGATAEGIFRLLEVEALSIHGEILEGIVVGRLTGGLGDGMEVVTKAGGFGKEDALERVIDALVLPYA